MIQFTVPGQPVAKGRPRISTRGGFARAYTPAKTVAFEGLIALAGEKVMDGREPLEGAVSLEVVATFQIPPSWPKRKKAEAAAGTLHHTGKPDADNLCKAVGDGLNGVTWRDDSQISELSVRKRYGAIPGLTVRVVQIGGAE